MASELIIESHESRKKIVLLVKGKIVEYHEEDMERPYRVGDVYVARVKEFSRNLNAAQIELGHSKSGFLHYFDLGMHFDKMGAVVESYQKNQKKKLSIQNISLGEPIPKEGKVEHVLKKGQKILVQITKEAINTKGLRVAAHLTFIGRYMLLMPLGNKVNLSKKITDITERERLKTLFRSIKPKNFSVTIRTAAMEQPVEVLHKEMNQLVQNYEKLFDKLYKKKVGTRVFTEVNRVSSILRDLLHEPFNQVIVDTPDLYDQIRSYVAEVAPEKRDIVQLHKHKTKLLEHFALNRELKRLFSPIVMLSGGGYIVLEETEAGHVIDVNSGSQKATYKDHQDLPLRVNLEAVKEIIRQFRLRPMGGNIFIDFIGMSRKKDRDTLYQRFKELLKLDPGTTKILPISDFGIMEVTRKRSRPARQLPIFSDCPCCMGHEKIEDPLLVLGWLEGHLEAMKQRHEQAVTIYVHPFVAAYLTHGWLSKLWKWRARYKWNLTVHGVAEMPLLSYKIKSREGKSYQRPFLTKKKSHGEKEAAAGLTP